MHRTNLRIVEEISKFVSYNILSLWLFSLNGFDFIILLRDGDNDLLQELHYNETSMRNKLLRMYSYGKPFVAKFNRRYICSIL